MVRDADNDRESDSLLTEVFETFEITFDELKQYVNLEINQLIQEIQDSSDSLGRKKSNKATMVNILKELKDLISENSFELAYDKLFHDIKPKLTGLKTDAYEIPWGNGIFKNPWVICNELQEVFRLICNEILTHITNLISYNLDQLLLTSTFSRIAIPSPNYNVFFLLGILSVILLNLRKKVIKSLRFD